MVSIVTGAGRGGRGPAARAFSLIELLTVIFIISLLIAILIPSLTSARNAAKRTTTQAGLNAIRVALESFKNDNERDFKSTNGYPPSFSHPPIGQYLTLQESVMGKFPYLEGKPVAYGAHWIPAALIGTDAQGFVKRGTTASLPANKQAPWEWYKPLDSGKLVDRTPLYLDPAGLRLVATKDLPGFRNTQIMTDQNWGDENSENDRKLARMPVVVDAFGQAILYYAANAYGKTTNLVEDERVENNDYGTDKDPPFYFHQDNEGFTGKLDLGGWSYGGSNAHWIAKSGKDATALNIESLEEGRTFARYILDRNSYRAIVNRTERSPMRPVNADTYLLISAGVDGLYGSSDDVTNFPSPVE
jgi:prepilin-type N-terminal cleavage/methylation domain-containing protein